ncbi:MAG TPA: branched-chain amino acid ABC transporter permease [Xanthobacteraceae bacterium]
MELFFQVVISGITLGSLYSLVGLGFVVIYRATKVVNFAQGEMMMLGAMFALYFYSDLGAPYFAAFLLAVLLCGTFGAALERVAYRPLLNAPVVTLILATVAVGQMMRAAVRILRGSEVSRFPSILSAEPFVIAGLTFTPLSLSIITIAILLVCAFMLFFRNTRIGKGMEATSENRDAALLVGISVNQTFSLVWAIGSALAGAAGVLLAPLIIITPEMGSIGIKGFIGAILGGFNSIPGAVAGCFLLGVIENLGGVYIASSMKDVIAFCVLVLILTIKPHGLFGRKEGKRA